MDLKKQHFLKSFITRLEMPAYCVAIGCNKPDLYWVDYEILRDLFEYSNKGGRSKIAEQFNFTLNNQDPNFP
jgi:hypothetical protein